jgi:hypothetical protein
VGKKSGDLESGMNELMTMELPSGLGLGPISDITEWRETGERLASAHKAVNWLIGDWWNASPKGADRVAEAARIFPHLSHDTMRKFGSVAGKFEVCRRRNTLDWSLYAEAASLPVSDADRLLGEAEENRWTVQALRDRVATCRGRAPLPRWLPTREMPRFDRADAKEAIYDAIAAAASAGEVCPTADDLAEASGVGSVSTTVALMHVLEAEQRIDVQRFQRGRIVTIKATGESTAAPSDTSAHWRDRPRELPTPAPQKVNERPTIATEIFARARAKGMSAQDYLAHLVWLGWEVECAIDSANEAAGARDAA